MEIIRRKTDYGIRALAHMTLTDSERRVFGARDIAEARDVPEVYMQKVLHALAEAGIVQSHRGVFGGFSMVKEPEDITLLSLMEALQGPVAINKCALGQGLCPREKDCGVRGRWCDIQGQLHEFLSGITLADLLADFADDSAAKRSASARTSRVPAGDAGMYMQMH